jgi:hypothetical protein
MNITKIIISGDSFTHGFDLCYDKFGNPPYSKWIEISSKWTPEQHQEFADLRLSGRLKKLFNCEIVDLSWSGESNDYIANSLITYIEDNKETIDFETTLVIAGWSEPDRFPFYLDNGVLNTCISLVPSYIEVTTRFVPQTDHDQQSIKNYNQLLGLYNLWQNNQAFNYTGYYHHTSLITLLQIYLEKMNIRYCFFNSLPTKPLKPNYIFHKMNDYGDKIIDWSNWYPYKSRDSYDWSWDMTLRPSKDMHYNEKYHTDSMHPNILAVEEHSQNLYNFIKKNY